MPRKPRFFLPDVPAHIVQRGYSREPVFFVGIRVRAKGPEPFTQPILKTKHGLTSRIMSILPSILDPPAMVRVKM